MGKNVKSILDDKALWENLFPGLKGSGAGGGWPPFWTPDEGDSITAQVKAVKTSAKTGKNYYHVATESPDGKSGRLLVMPGTTAIYAAFGRAGETYGHTDVGVGSIIFARFNGMKVSEKSGFKYAAYDCFVSPISKAKEVLEAKDVESWEGTVQDADVKKMEKRQKEREKETKGKSADKEEDKDHDFKEPKTSGTAELLQSAIDETNTMVTVFPQVPLRSVTKMLKKLGVEMETEDFLDAAGFEVKDGSIVRPED